MDFEHWEPIYEEILEDFNYSRNEDRRAAKMLEKKRGTDSLEPLKPIRNSVVEILGPFGEGEIIADYIIAAGSAVSNASDIDADLDLMVTDMDGDLDLQVEKNNKGVTAALHAHGDNIELIDEHSENFKGPVISTCQCEPLDDVYNFGGFTDGDRALFIADHFGAEKIILNGWDFDDPAEGERKIKKKKLRWAKRLLRYISTPIEYR